MNSYYKTLELHKILEMLSWQTANEESKIMALQIKPLTDVDEVKAEMQKTSDAFNLTVKFGTPEFYNIKNIVGSLKRASSGSKLSLRELLNISFVLTQIRNLCNWYKQCEDIENSLQNYFNHLVSNKSLEEKINNSIISEEEISDNASTELYNIRRKIISAGEHIKNNLDKMLKSSSVNKCLQESIITMRDGRYVLPVKSEYKNTVQGLVHDTSSSGSTIFIEPIAVVEANNNIRILKGREQEEIERIITALSIECANNAETIIKSYYLCNEINLYFAKANLAAKMKASVPEIASDGEIILKKARHPLIESDKVIPINVELGNLFDALIITGPNTGGKTVVLKTIGLLTLMTMCGLMIPVDDGSKISVYKNVLVDIGDEQSIEQNLSTFSSHINRVVNILKICDKDSLILIDELGSGTDPIEGAALAVSIIQKILSCYSKIVVTTHYQELKMFAIKTDNVENASCEFDVNTLKPTYRLIIGSPGKSNAFAISKRLGIEDDVIKYAENLVSTENKRFEEVIEQLEKARFELEQKNREIAQLNVKLKEDSEAVSKELTEIRKNKDSELERARLQAMRIVETVRIQSDDLLDELAKIRKQKEKENFSDLLLNVKSKAKSSINKMYEIANPVVESNNEYKLPRPLKRGDTVLLIDTNKEGIVSSDVDNNGFVFIQCGIMKTKINIKKLRLIEKPKITFQNKKINLKNVKSKIERKISMELDIRGMNVDEGICEVSRFIDNAVMSGLGLITIIHGKGTGVLRNGIHRYLEINPSVKSFRLGIYGEGEDGVTIVELK